MEARGLSAAPAKRRVRVPGTAVLLYHAVGASADRYTVSRAELALHLQRIAAAGAQVVSLADLRAGADEWTFPVVITFDDGRASDYEEAFPLLAQHGFTAEFFVNPATVGQRGFVTWEQAREMARWGMSIQSHGYEHVYLTREGEDGLVRQVAGSKVRIEEEIGVPVSFLAAPYGDVNARVVEEAVAAGYQAVCTSWPWPARADAWTVSRVSVYGGTPEDVFDRMLAGDPRPYVAQAARAALAYPAKQALLRLHPGWRKAQREGRA
jgi:peptidoglycan/xylan/chitin deacetylase (PgdA/CDA1 family)